MKKVYWIGAVFCVVALLVNACKKMDSTYKEFIVPGGITYAGKITSPMVYAGRYRIKIAWLRGSDPNVTSAKIYWNNYQDSTALSIPPTGDTVSVIIDNLLEQRYSFIVKTFDDKGNTSVPVELQGESYGTKYETYLVDRPVISSEVDTNSVLTIQWGNADITGGAFATEVQYTDMDGRDATKFFSAGDSVSYISDFPAGTTYRYRTVYVPDSMSIDSFYTDYVQENVVAKIKKAGLVVTTDSYAPTSQLPKGGPAQFAFDDDLTTYWHTHHTPPPVPGFPHWLAVDLTRTYHIYRAELTCRPNVTNTFTAFTLQGSMDGTTWTSYGSFTLIQQNPTQRFNLSSVGIMRYFRIYATAGPNAYANLAEFSIFGY